MSLRARVGLRLGDLDLDVALEAAAGEVVAVLGPNGAGKTTLLRALAGLLPLAAGRVELGGKVLEDAGERLRVPPERRRTGVVFQDYLLFPNLSALDNVAFGPRCRGLDAASSRRLARDWLARVGLAGQAGARPGALSGGQAQRVALARALASGPALLLLDEPLAALDVEARGVVRRSLQAHLEEFAGPCVLVTHEPVEAIALADRLVVVEGGRVVQEGSAGEVARRPRSPWVARLVGLNLYRGRASGYEVVLDGGRRLASVEEAHGEVFAVVHPRAVALHPTQPAGSPRNTWRGRVDGVDVDRHHVRVHVGEPLPLVAEITPAALADLAIAPGREVWVAIKATEVDLYPR